MANYNAPTVEGGKLTCNFTGAIDTIHIIEEGLYKFLLYGAKGGNGSDSVNNIVGYGGSGGRTEYFIHLLKDDIIYLVCGGAGSTLTSYGQAGGYNGGGGSYSDYAVSGAVYKGGSGGGATHIATKSGLLSSLSGNRGSVLAVAGGGGGAGSDYNGGAGGGSSGTAGAGAYPGGGGTQTSGGTHNSYSLGPRPSFGVAGGQEMPYAGAGGGGLYGGGAGAQFDAGGGGAGYIKTATTIYKNKTYTNFTAVGGGPAGRGYAIIEYIQKPTPTMYYGDLLVDAIYWGDRIVDAAYYGDAEVQ